MGSYCVTAPGINPATVPAAVSLDAAAGTRAVAVLAAGPNCAAGYEVLTTDNATSSDAVGFTIVIP